MEHDQDESPSLVEPSAIFDFSSQVGSTFDQNSFNFGVNDDDDDDNDIDDVMTVTSTKSFDHVRSSGDPRSPAQLVRRLGQFNMRRDPIVHRLSGPKAPVTNSSSQHEGSTTTKTRQPRDASSSQELTRQITNRMVTAAPQQRLDEFRKKYQQLRREPKNSFVAPYDFSFRYRRDLRHQREDGFDDALSIMTYSTDTNFSAFNQSTQQSVMGGGDDNPFASQAGDGGGRESVASFNMVDDWEPPLSSEGKGKAPMHRHHSISSQHQLYRPSSLSQRVFDLDDILANENAASQQQQQQRRSSAASSQQQQQRRLSSVSSSQQQQQRQLPISSNQQQQSASASQQVQNINDVMSSEKLIHGVQLSPHPSVTSQKHTDSQLEESQQQQDVDMDYDDFEFDDMPMDDSAPPPHKAGLSSQSASSFAGAGADAVASGSSSSKAVDQPMDDVLDEFDFMSDENGAHDLKMMPQEGGHPVSRSILASRRIDRVSPQSRYGLRRLHDFDETAPSFRSSIIISRIAKTIFSSATNTTITADATKQLSHITNIFFEQAMDNMTSYAKHAGRDTITEDDAMLLLKRQEVLHDKTSLEALAHQYLPRELWDELCVSATAFNVLYPSKDE